MTYALFNQAILHATDQQLTQECTDRPRPVPSVLTSAHLQSLLQPSGVSPFPDLLESINTVSKLKMSIAFSWQNKGISLVLTGLTIPGLEDAKGIDLSLPGHGEKKDLTYYNGCVKILQSLVQSHPFNKRY